MTTTTLETPVRSRHLTELAEQGFTIFPGLLERGTTAAVREYIDRAVATGRINDVPGMRLQQRIRHPNTDPIMAKLAANELLADVARQCLRCQQPGDLRLRQQMFMRTIRAVNPVPPPTGGHVDSPFLARERDAVPRQTYIQFFAYCNDVRPGGGGVYVSPRSHLRAYEYFAGLNQDHDRDVYAPAWVGQVSFEPPVEVTGGEGDVIVFDPMCIHSASDNRTDQTRYVYHCSYFDASAPWIRQRMDVMCDPFPTSLRAALPDHLQSLVAMAGQAT